MSTNIELTCLTGQVSAPPGGELALRFGVTNRGPSTDRVQLRVLAVPPDAAHISPPELSLSPAESGLVEVRIRLPAQAPTGSFPAALRAVSANTPTEFTDLPFDIVVVALPTSTARPVQATAPPSGAGPPAQGPPPTPQMQSAHPSSPAAPLNLPPSLQHQNRHPPRAYPGRMECRLQHRRNRHVHAPAAKTACSACSSFFWCCSCAPASPYSAWSGQMSPALPGC